MRVAYVRTGEPRDRCYLTRPDGSVGMFRPHSYGGGFPHDLAHFAVERALRIAGGFWGLLADGVDWDRVNEEVNRGGRDALGRDVTELQLAEGAVAALGAADDHHEDRLEAVYSSVGVTAPPDLGARAARARADLLEMAAHWGEVVAGGQMLLEWPDELRPSVG